jgi:hypothetical protein
MLSLAALVLFVAGVACLLRDGHVNQTRRAVVLVRGDEVDLERMFRLPSRLPRHSERA